MQQSRFVVPQLSASTAARFTTPAKPNKRKATELTYGETTINSFKQPAAKLLVKSPAKTAIQKGNGFRTRFKWKKI